MSDIWKSELSGKTILRLSRDPENRFAKFVIFMGHPVTELCSPNVRCTIASETTLKQRNLELVIGGGGSGFLLTPFWN